MQLLQVMKFYTWGSKVITHNNCTSELEDNPVQCALSVCLTLLASFFLPSHLSFKNMYIHVHVHVPAQFSPVPCRRRAQLHFPAHSESTGTALLPAGSPAGTCLEYPGSGGGKDSRHSEIE